MPLDGKSYDQVCGLLDTGHPVVIGLSISQSFYTPDTEGVIGQKGGDLDTGSHAVIAVGYGRTSEENCMLIRNSWGPTWGLNGHAFIKRSYMESRLILTSAMV